MIRILLILPLFALLSMTHVFAAESAAGTQAADSAIRRCTDMRLDQDLPHTVGYALKKTKIRDIDIGDGPVIIQPAMAGLRGPSVTLLGRDVRLAVVNHQSSPQELWHKAQWNGDRISACKPIEQNWLKRTRRGFYWKGIFDNEIGYNKYEPTMLYRSRVIADAMFVQPRGFIFDLAMALPLGTNTSGLMWSPDPRAPVRRDMAQYAVGASVERLYASWRRTPLTDVHLAVTGGYLEEMYGGAGAEVVWRPFGSPFWAGADGWEVWRRDGTTPFNLRWTDERHFTGHVRAGYDVPDSHLSFAIAAGQYLAGDMGASVSVTQTFDFGLRLEAGLTWTDRREDEGTFPDTHFDPRIRAVWSLGRGKHREVRTTMHQLGRDGGQQLERPLPLEQLSEKFSTRAIARAWPNMFE